jgi:hypothetical protein
MRAQLLFWEGLTRYTSCVACARIRDAGVFAGLSDLLRVLAQGCKEGWMGQARYVPPRLLTTLSLGRTNGLLMVRRFGSTGTRWDGICFRRFLLDTVPDLGPSLTHILMTLPY